MLFSKGKKANAQQANAQEPLVALDIGTYKVRLIAGMVGDEGEITVSYYDVKSSYGMKAGSVSDLKQLSDVLSELVHKYESETGNTFTHCFIGISGCHIESRNEVGEATVPTHTITETDRSNALQHARSIKIADYKHIIHSIPQAYMTDVIRDNFESDRNAYIINPIGMSAMRLSVGVHLIACDEDQESNLRSAVESLSQNSVVDHVFFNGYAAAEAVLTQAEKDIGVCLIDFGGGAVNVSVYNDGKLILTFGINQGGGAVDREIAKRFGTSLGVSDYLKRHYGVSHPCLMDAEQTTLSICTPVSENTEDKVMVPMNNLANVICYKLSDIFAMISNRIENYARSIKEPIMIGGGFVLTGGMANIRGIEQLASSQLGQKDNTMPAPVKIRIGIPRGVIGDYDDLATPDCATAVGLLRIAHSVQQDENHKRMLADERKRQSNVIVKGWNAFREWMSDEL